MRAVRRCKCGRVSDPLVLGIVCDAWIDRLRIAHFEFKCPQCCTKNVVYVEWIGK